MISNKLQFIRHTATQHISTELIRTYYEVTDISNRTVNQSNNCSVFQDFESS